MTANGRNDVDTVHERVRMAILQGDLAPGAEVSQVRLAHDLGVSRTPLREALRMLQREGLVESEPNRQVRIAGFSMPDLEDLYVLRLTLEAAAVRLSASRVTPEDVAALEGELARMAHFAELRDHQRWEVPHAAYHARLVAYAGARIRALLRQLADHSSRYRRLMRSEIPRAWTDAGAEHRQILDAVKEGNAKLAASRVAAHLAHTATAVIEIVDPDYEPQMLTETLQQLTGGRSPWR